MDSQSNKPEEKLDQSTAIQFIRFFWVAFNNINMYGSAHPLARKGAENYHSFLQRIDETIFPITFYVEGENILCEKWKTSQSVNVGRLAERLRTAGIYSISFQKDVSKEDILETFRIIADAKNYQNIDQISKALNDQEVKGIRFNTFIYKRVSAEEAEQEEQSEDSRKKFSSLKEKENQFEDMVVNLLGRYFIDDKQEPLSAVDQLEILRERLILDDENRSALPTDEILNALMYLKSIRSDDTDPTLATGHAAKPGKEILFELERLTFELVTKFVQDKFRSGTLSPKQFGKIVRNLFTDTDDLKILFPKIKEVLMADGMTLPEYLTFVHETSVELGETGFLNLLKQIGGDIGVSLNEISDDLKKNPYIPIHLIILTLKVFSLLGVEPEQIIAVLSQSIGILIQNKTLEYIRGKENIGIDEIRGYISEIENRFLDDIEKEGIIKELVLDLKGHLQQRNNILTGQVWSEWLLEKVSEDKQIPDYEHIKILSEIISKSKESKDFINYLLIVMEEKGYKKELLDELIHYITDSATEVKDERIRAETEPEKKMAVPLRLPKGISRHRETKTYLQNEIYRNHRHKTSFSCISLSVSHITQDSETRLPAPKDLAEIFQVLSKILLHSLREIDFLGSLGTLKENYLLVIMTMTDRIGCQQTEERIASVLSEFSIKTDGSVLRPYLSISSITFEQDQTPDIRTVVRRIKSTHRKKIKSQEKP